MATPLTLMEALGTTFVSFTVEIVGKACYLIATNSSKTVGQAINFCQDETPTYAEFLECVAKCAGVTPPAAKEGNKTITEVSPFSNYEGQWILDTTKAQQLLGWKTTPMKEWMPVTVDWHKENTYFTGGDLPVADKAINSLVTCSGVEFLI
jgi:nucleoside-diphosphate-sugar epimerase